MILNLSQNNIQFESRILLAAKSSKLVSVATAMLPHFLLFSLNNIQFQFLNYSGIGSYEKVTTETIRFKGEKVC